MKHSLNPRKNVLGATIFVVTLVVAYWYADEYKDMCGAVMILVGAGFLLHLLHELYDPPPILEEIRSRNLRTVLSRKEDR